MTRRYILIAVRTLAVAAALAVSLALLEKLLGGEITGAGPGQWTASLTREDVVGLIRGSGHWGVLVSMGLMVLHSFVPFPSEFLTMANGMVYGPLWGTLISWAGAMLGALTAYYLALWFGSGFVRRFMGPERSEGMDRWLEYNGPGALFLARLIPVVSFNLVNYASGLARVPIWTFIWTTAVGMLPVTVIVVYMGANIDKMAWWQWGIIFSAGIAVWVAFRLYRRRRVPAG